MKEIIKTITSQILTSVITIGIIAGGGYAFAAKQAGDAITAADWNQLIKYVKGDWEGSKTFENPTMKGLYMIPTAATEEAYCISHGYDYADKVINMKNNEDLYYLYVVKGPFGKEYNEWRRNIRVNGLYGRVNAGRVLYKYYWGSSLSGARTVLNEKTYVPGDGSSNVREQGARLTPISVIKTITCKKY